MKTITLAALSLAAVSAFAQPMQSGKIMMSEDENAMFPSNMGDQAEYIRSTVYKYAMTLPAPQRDALNRIDNRYSDNDTLALFTGIYNNIVRSKQIRKEMAISNLSPELRATISMDGYTMMGEGDGRALKMVAENKATEISYPTAAQLLTADLKDVEKSKVYNAFYGADERDRDAVVCILRGLAMEARTPIYASTLIQRSYTNWKK